jgi:Putative lumazine-binding
MQTQFQTESEIIIALFDDYFEGIYTGNAELLGPVFHNHCLFFGDVNGELTFRTKEEYIKVVKARKSPQEIGEPFNMKILSVEIIGLTATAKLHVPMLGFNYYDFIALAQINGQWQIISNLYSHVADN